MKSPVSFVWTEKFGTAASAFRFAVIAAATVIAWSQNAFAAENEWPQFRGPTGQGVSAAKNVPVEWNATTHVAWKVEIPGRGWSSPVLAGGRVYLTVAADARERVEGNGPLDAHRAPLQQSDRAPLQQSDRAPLQQTDSADVSLRALCLDARDGRVIWQKEIFRPNPESTAAMHRKNSPASGTPIVTAERLYVHFGHMGTAALDLSGKVVWRQTELKYSPVHGNGGSPILVDDALIFSCDGGDNPFVVALDAGSGAVRWKTPRNSSAKKQFSFSTPLAIEVGKSRQIISPTSGFVGAYDPLDGHELWRVGYGEGYSVIPRPAFGHGLIFISSGFEQPILYAIKPDGAAGDVTGTHVAWTHRKGVPHTASMLVLGDELYFVSDAGIATCVDARTGAVHWTERLGGDFSASPVAAEGRIYFQNETGVGYVVRADKSFALLATNDLGERTLASYAVADDALFIRSEKHLWKIAR